MTGIQMLLLKSIAEKVLNLSLLTFESLQLWNMNFNATWLLKMYFKDNCNRSAVKLFAFSLQLCVWICIQPPVLVQEGFSGYLPKHCE